jgi:hypothetical protein
MVVVKQIPSFKVREFEARINKLNKRAEKLGLELTAIKIVGTKIRYIWIENTFGEHSQPVVCSSDMPSNDSWPVEYTLIEVTETAQIKIKGWEFQAVIDFRAEQNMVYPIRDDITVPEKYRTQQCCEHCNINRRRVRTFVLRHENGDYKCVGSGCLIDFVGHAEAEKIAQMLAEKYILDMQKELNGDVEDFTRERNGDHQLFSVVELISRSILIIKEYGEYVSYGAAQERHVSSTSEVLRQHVVNYKAPENNTEAEKLIEWFNAKFPTTTENTNSYVNNLRAAIVNKFVPKKDMGLLASFPAFAAKEQEKEKRALLPVSNKFFGNVGERIVVTGTVTGLISFTAPSFYGKNGVATKFIWKIVDAQGNLFVWFTELGNVDKGSVVVLKGTIKEHKTYNGECQTVLTRCKIQ